MWAALTSDFKEFVSGVEEETAVVTTKLTQSVENLELGGDVTGEDGLSLESGFEATGMVVSVSDEVARRRTLTATYTEPLDESRPDVVAFVETFDLESETDQIATLLGTSASVKECFEMVCPEQVAYKDFWMRYFYRCDEGRIQLEWDQEYQEKKLAREAAISSGIATVTSLFGGAVAAVSKAVERVDKSAQEPVPASPFAFNAGASLFGGRPPFVLNTAVDEDDDDDEQEEEVEEELGWGDDDESFEDEEKGHDEGEPEEQKEPEEEIEFTGGVADDKLTEALAERDALHQTVALQAKELAALKNGKESPAILKQVEELTMKLFEKDAELAAFKASGEDKHMDDKQAKLDHANIKNLEATIDELKKSMDQQAADMAKAKEQFEFQLATQVEDADAKMAALVSPEEDGQLSAALQDAKGAKEECESLKLQLRDAQRQVTLVEESCNELKVALAEAKAAMEAQKASFDKLLKEETAKIKVAAEDASVDHCKEIESLNLQLQKMQSKADASDEKVVDLTAQLVSIRTAINAKSVEEKSFDTCSSGVQIPIPESDDDNIPVPTIVAAPEQELSATPTVNVPASSAAVQEGEEDWGDDW